MSAARHDVHIREDRFEAETCGYCADEREPKNAPIELQLGEGDDLNTNQQEGDRSTMSISDTTDTRQAVHPDVQRIFDDIAAVPEGHHLYLEPGDPLYGAPVDDELHLVSQHRCTLEELRDRIKRAHSEWWAAVFDASGTRVPLAERDEAWWEREFEGIEPNLVRSVSRRPNGVLRTANDFLVVSRGMFVPVEETEVDGEPAVKFVTEARWLQHRKEQRRARAAAFLEEHPEVVAAKPAWAEDVIADVDDEGVTVTFHRECGGGVGLSREAEFEDGRLRFLDDTTAPAVYRSDVEDAGPDKLRDIAAGLMAAADVLDTYEIERLGDEVFAGQPKGTTLGDIVAARRAEARSGAEK